MDKCPLCSGRLMTRFASVGEETYCLDCRGLIVSASLGFRLAGDIEQCSIDGLPGWKGPGEKAKCYTFDPGNPGAEDKARERAKQSAYMEERHAHVAKLVESTQFGLATESDMLIPAATTTKDGVLTGTGYDVGSGGGPTSTLASLHPSNRFTDPQFQGLGRAYCTACGGNHSDEIDCPDSNVITSPTSGI